MTTLMSFFLSLGGALDNAGAVANVERVLDARREEDAALDALVSHLPQPELAEPQVADAA